jgi:maltodextrin utilization protein YvdJ
LSESRECFIEVYIDNQWLIVIAYNYCNCLSFQICSYFTDPQNCIGPVAVNRVYSAMEHTAGEKRLSGHPGVISTKLFLTNRNKLECLFTESQGAMTFSIRTFSITTFSIKDLLVTLGIKEAHHNETRHMHKLSCWVSLFWISYFLIVMLNVVMLSVFMLSVIVFSVVAPFSPWMTCHKTSFM